MIDPTLPVGPPPTGPDPSLRGLPPQVGRYRVEGLLGRGGMGLVLRATDPGLGRPVAVKLLLAGPAGGEELLRFRREAQATGQLQHPGIVTVYEVGAHAGAPFLAMELVDGGSLALFCTPAVNLFPKRLDRVQLGPGSWEYHLVPDRTRPMDLEVHSVATVVGHAAGRDPQREFRPLFTAHHVPPAEGHGYYTLRREPRLMSDRQRLQGPRSSYIGEEVFLSLSDPGHGAYRESLRQLSVTAWVTNRDLPTLLPQAGTAGASAWRLDAPGPVTQVECMRGPTRPVSRRPLGDIGWHLVSQLTQNHLSLEGSPAQAGAALRDMLRLYGPPGDLAWGHQVDGLLSLQVKPSVRRLPFRGPLCFGSGVELTLEVNELAFQGSSAFLLASVLERYHARHAAINSYTQFTLRSQQRGLIKTWPARIGQRPTL